MKFIMIGRPEIEIEGVWLTPKEYLTHPAYHGMVKEIDGPRLFLANPAGRGWAQLSPSYCTAYQLIEATDEEQSKMWATGYRMLGLDKPGAQRCRLCNKPMNDGDTFFGPKGWNCEHPTCGHGNFILCPSCGENWDNLKCPTCGCCELFC